jgi:hypothetical protein
LFLPWFAAVLAGCEAVPTLTFESSDADVDATTGDGGPVPPPDDAAVGCPDAAPQGSVCCGSVACYGVCASACATCEAECDAASICCAHANNVVCRPPGAPCN